MKLLGNRVYLNLPDMKETKVSISDELKQELREEQLSKFDKLEVFAFSECEEVKKSSLKIGDKVYVEPMGLKRGTVIKIDGKDKVSVSIFDVMHIW